MAGIMTAPFYRALGFSREAIAATGWFSLGGTLAGIALGGWLVARLGTGRALLRTGWAQTLAMAMYLLLAVSAGEHARAVRDGHHRGVRPGHGRRGVHHLPVRPVLARVHRDALCAAVVARGDRGAHDRRRVWRAGRAGWAGSSFYALCMFAALPSMGLMLVLLATLSPRRAKTSWVSKIIS